MTHIYTHACIHAAVSPCRVNSPSVKISIRARLLYGFLSETSNSAYFPPDDVIFFHLPIVRVAWSNEFLARSPSSRFIRVTFLYIQGRLYGEISLYKTRIRRKTPPRASRPVPRIIWITSSWSHCWNFMIALTAAAAAAAAVTLKMRKQCSWAVDDVYR